MQIEPIGTYHGAAAWKFDAPRQGTYSGGSGVVELLPQRNFETALRDLDGFERIWLIFLFDRNGSAWRPTTRPPLPPPGHERVGLFASRSPYRPNPIGLSCVRLLAVKGLSLEVAECDLLDNTPILDIKPYLPKADAFPDAKAGWTDLRDDSSWTVLSSPLFARQAAYVKEISGYDLSATAEIQLAHDPLDSSRKRVAVTDEGTAVLSLRMFRIVFTVNAAAREVTLTELKSGYSAAELADSADPYADKAVHRLFSSWSSAQP